MVADSGTALLIMSEGPRQQVSQHELVSDQTINVPFWWVLRRRTIGGILCLPDMTCGTVQRADVVGLAQPADLEIPLSTYLADLVITTLTLHPLVRLRLELQDIRQLTLPELTTMLIESVRRNPNHYTRASAQEIETSLKRAKTFSQVVESFD